MSVRDCQAVSKKAIVRRLMEQLGVSRLPETGARFPIGVSVVNDRARITLDMSGEALNRRGYRTWNGEAPLRETLAAALVDLSPWRPGMPLYDPCCGTGTLLIEAAFKAMDRPAGLARAFACESYPFMDRAGMDALRREAREAFRPDAPLSIAGSDIDPEALSLCGRHIRQAGLEGRIAVRRAGPQNAHAGRPRRGVSAQPALWRAPERPRRSARPVSRAGRYAQAPSRLEAVRHLRRPRL